MSAVCWVLLVALVVVLILPRISRGNGNGKR